MTGDQIYEDYHDDHNDHDDHDDDEYDWAHLKLRFDDNHDDQIYGDGDDKISEAENFITILVIRDEGQNSFITSEKSKSFKRVDLVRNSDDDNISISPDLW